MPLRYRIVTDPTGASVLEGGRKIGTTPLIVRCGPDAYPQGRRLVLAKYGYWPSQIRLAPDVALDEIRSVHVKLEPATTAIFFAAPKGAQLKITIPAETGTGVRTVEYRFPALVKLAQELPPEKVKEDAGGRPIGMVLPDGTRLRGYLHVYMQKFDEVESLARVEFRLTEEDMAKLKSGKAVTVIGYSARNRPVYKINLGLE